MVKLLARTGKISGRNLALAILVSTLVACGGGAGDATPLGEQDFDQDGEPNATDPDADGDGVLDVDDLFVDLDLDNIDDVFGDSDPNGDGIAIKDQDLDNDLIANKDDLDADGDDIADFDDDFIDLDGDGRDDKTGNAAAPAFTPVSSANPCGSESGSDSASENATWGDNCLIRRSIHGGQFADSLYSAGVQRIIWCAGFDNPEQPSSTYTAFAEGEYGRNSEVAMGQFQSATSIPAAGADTFQQISADGRVGPNTWGKLQSVLTRLEAGQAVTNAEGTSSVAYDAYGFEAGRCANTTLFYQEVTLDIASQQYREGGWSLAKNAPNTDQRVPFSVDSPFNKL